jgi:cyclopropane fatty-acyl-phospholipid synthase-like methyltransferase
MKGSYEKEIIEYYEDTESSYVDGWDLHNSLAMHYGYKDSGTRSFGDTLIKMNAVLAAAAGIKSSDHVLDAGCGVGGSCFYLAREIGCSCTGISLSEKQIAKANRIAGEKGHAGKVAFQTMSYLETGFPEQHFDVVWGLESICYATDKEQFVKEAFRLLKPGGRLIIADGMVTDFQNNEHPIIKKWLQGWKVNYLESPERFQGFFENAGFKNIRYTDITPYTRSSSKRLLLLYYANQFLAGWKKLTGRYRTTAVQKQNIDACLYQYKGMKQKLWGYGMIVGEK